MIHTCPAGFHQRVRTIYWTPAGTLGLVQFIDGGGARLVEEVPAAVGQVGKPFDGWLVLEAGNTLAINCVAATQVFYVVSGTTYTN